MELTEILKVKVLKCSEANFWYKEYVGKIFKVVKEPNDDDVWRVINPPRKAVKYIRETSNWRGGLWLQRKDCEDEFFILMRTVLDG